MSVAPISGQQKVGYEPFITPPLSSVSQILILAKLNDIGAQDPGKVRPIASSKLSGRELGVKIARNGDIRFTLAIVYSPKKKALRVVVKKKDDKYFTPLIKEWKGLANLMLAIVQSEHPFQLLDLSPSMGAKK